MGSTQSQNKCIANKQESRKHQAAKVTTCEAYTANQCTQSAIATADSAKETNTNSESNIQRTPSTKSKSNHNSDSDCECECKSITAINTKAANISTRDC